MVVVVVMMFCGPSPPRPVAVMGKVSPNLLAWISKCKNDIGGRNLPMIKHGLPWLHCFRLCCDDDDDGPCLHA